MRRLNLTAVFIKCVSIELWEIQGLLADYCFEFESYLSMEYIELLYPVL